MRSVKKHLVRCKNVLGMLIPKPIKSLAHHLHVRAQYDDYKTQIVLVDSGHTLNIMAPASWLRGKWKTPEGEVDSSRVARMHNVYA